MPASGNTELGILRGIFGYSFLMDGLMRRLGYEAFWYAGGWENQRVNTDGERISCLLMERVSASAIEANLGVILLAQYLEREVLVDQTAEVKNVLECAARNGIGILDTHVHLTQIAESDPMKFESLFFHQSHMTPQGNAFVARVLFDFLIGRNYIG